VEVSEFISDGRSEEILPVEQKGAKRLFARSSIMTSLKFIDPTAPLNKTIVQAGRFWYGIFG